MLRHPAFVARLNRSDPQGVAFLAQQGIATITRAVRPDLTRFGKMADVFVAHVAGPGRVLLVRAERSAHGMQSADELTVLAQQLEHAATHPRHDVHAGNDIRRISDFNPNLRNRGTHHAHAVGNHVHRAAGHRAGIKLGEFLFHLHRVFPIVCRARIIPGSRANESSVFHAGHVGRMRADQHAIPTFCRI